MDAATTFYIKVFSKVSFFFVQLQDNQTHQERKIERSKVFTVDKKNIYIKYYQMYYIICNYVALFLLLICVLEHLGKNEQRSFHSKNIIRKSLTNFINQPIHNSCQQDYCSTFHTHVQTNANINPSYQFANFKI